MRHPYILISPGAIIRMGSLPVEDPHVAIQFVAQVCPLLPATYLNAPGRSLTRLAQGQINRMAQWRNPLLLFVEEPCLTRAPAPGSITDKPLGGGHTDVTAHGGGHPTPTCSWRCVRPIMAQE
jgi:hypothetical protein